MLCVKRHKWGARMSDAAYLREIIFRLRGVASDCFDLQAVERLRLLSEEIERRLSLSTSSTEQPSGKGRSGGI
jgi:hypothetical protein